MIVCDNRQHTSDNRGCFMYSSIALTLIRSIRNYHPLERSVLIEGLWNRRGVLWLFKGVEIILGLDNKPSEAFRSNSLLPFSADWRRHDTGAYQWDSFSRRSDMERKESSPDSGHIKTYFRRMGSRENVMSAIGNVIKASPQGMGCAVRGSAIVPVKAQEVR